eukprot:2854133-Pyramimonas_sp.AAC.1
MQNRCSSEGFSSVGHPCWSRFGALLGPCEVVPGPGGTCDWNSFRARCALEGSGRGNPVETQGKRCQIAAQ